MTGESSRTEVGPVLELLKRNDVDFVMVGGLAGAVHGSSLPTFDLDVAYSRRRENLDRLVLALRELDVRLRAAPADLPFQLDRRTLENGMNFTFTTRFGSVDILGEPAGIKSYEALVAASISHEVDGVEVRIASVDHLIAMKRAANRPKDRLMLEELLVISDEEAQEGEDA